MFRNKKGDIEASGNGTVCSLDVNYRSHADILSYADRIFGGEGANPLGRDFLHLDSCGEETRRGARKVGSGTSRRQAVLVCGGTADTRAEAKAAAVAARLKRLHDEEGFAPSDMVILMARLTKASTYAQAVRAAGMPCVVSGGTSVFRRAPEVGVIGALLAFLANPDDGENGITPLVTSPMFNLGATELLALSTCVNAETGITDTRSITGEVLLLAPIMEEFGPLPVLDRMREVLLRAASRAGRDRTSQIVRDAVVESGWLARLEEGGAQEHAVAANVLKALAIVEEEEEGHAFAPRLVARAFADHIAHVKESPAALSGAGEDAVRIMTVHASKGLEFPVVAVAECDGIRSNGDRIQFCDGAGRRFGRRYPTASNLPRTKTCSSCPRLIPVKTVLRRGRALCLPVPRRHSSSCGMSVTPWTTRKRRASCTSPSRELARSPSSRWAPVPLQSSSRAWHVARGRGARAHSSERLRERRLARPRCRPAYFDDAHACTSRWCCSTISKYPSKSGGAKRSQLVFHAEDYPLGTAASAVGMDTGGGAGGSAALDEGSCPMSAPEPVAREVLLVWLAMVHARAPPASTCC